MKEMNEWKNEMYIKLGSSNSAENSYEEALKDEVFIINKI